MADSVEKRTGDDDINHIKVMRIVFVYSLYRTSYEVYYGVRIYALQSITNNALGIYSTVLHNNGIVPGTTYIL